MNDYLFNGGLYLNNTIRPQHKKLAQLMIYATTSCQSRCRHCSIWRKPHEHLTLDDIQRMVRSRCVSRQTTIGLEGGEFILHPQSEAIMAWLRQCHPNFTLLSNGLAPERLEELVLRHPPRHLYLSLDGPRETYLRMRGVDGFDRVIRSAERLRRHVPISLMFCLSPWNSFEDMQYVSEVANRLEVDLRVGIYGTMSFFDTTQGLLPAEDFASHIPDDIRHTDQNYDYLALYESWRTGHLRLPCLSIRSQLVVHSNGDVPLCQNLDVTIGNIKEQSLDEIFNSQQTCRTQRHYGANCNACWINFHRKYDIILLSNLERLFPRALLRKVYGDYHWTEDKAITYRQFIKKLKLCTQN